MAEKVDNSAPLPAWIHPHVGIGLSVALELDYRVGVLSIFPPTTRPEPLIIVLTGEHTRYISHKKLNSSNAQLLVVFS